MRPPKTLLLAACLLAGAARGQEPTTSPLPQAPPAPSVAASPGAADTVAPDYRIGPGDVLDVTVFGNEDLSRSATVQTNGTISLPLLGEVPVAGMTIAEVRGKLTTLLAKDFLVNPQVDVKIREYQSQFVIVVGEVNSPGRKPLRGRTRLIDVLVDAGGFTPRASGEVVISRVDGSFAGGAKTLRLQLGGPSLSAQEQVNLEVALRNGDIITASAKQYVTVSGEVNKPGRYTIDGELTVTGAISIAGGLTRFGSNNVELRRINPQAGGPDIITKVDLKEIRKGKQPDIPLQANDSLYVPRRLF
jgi:polysaccharide export outer membrane protein